ncbi:Alpha/Beta hydrolase protein [Lineolata rhizophorae]|uniref:Carboxypeptidase n=1 Tax=Lineolata rhizophorae TaxID=578093 RepID=A0A6A6P919_9PEZI|nr:Alpha/Beta hydrolase protein [Lineolata rhizophorae]
MRDNMRLTIASALVALFAGSSNALAPPLEHPRHSVKEPRQLPPFPEGLKTIVSPTNVTIRYKEPGNEGFCETTPGVNSYSGYIDLAPNAHAYFYFFESRNDPANDPVTLWLNGGPGSDSLIGLFQELGPCNVTEELETMYNPYAWNNVSNMLFLSQPFGTGFSYTTMEAGSMDNVTGAFVDETVQSVTGRWPIADAEHIDTTQMAAVAAFHIMQGFYSALPQLDSEVSSKIFHLWTESYGGHYGPTFYDYFYEQNQLIANGSMPGTELHMDTLGIINGIIDSAIQTPYYPEFAVNNTYGIKAINDTVYNFMKFAWSMQDGCADYISYCRAGNKSSLSGEAVCSQAQAVCRLTVEYPYYSYGGRGVYDIRHPYDDPTPPDYFIDMLNTAEVQNILGVAVNYTTNNANTYYAFAQTGDFVWETYMEDLEYLLDQGVRVGLIYGDADYICNWFGGEAVSLAVNYTDADAFRASGYVPFTVDDTEYGEVRQYGNFSFLRIYESGHEIPYYQPEASLAFFDRTINHMILADGSEPLTDDYGTEGEPEATHTNPFVPLPSSTSSAAGEEETGGVWDVPIYWDS